VLDDSIRCASICVSDNIVVVKTSLGDVRGRVVPAPLGDLIGVIIDEFLGIPFAVPPVGQLRYADPVPLDRLPSGTLTPHVNSHVPRPSNDSDSYKRLRTGPGPYLGVHPLSQAFKSAGLTQLK